jgi:hypothetical protein
MSVKRPNAKRDGYFIVYRGGVKRADFDPHTVTDYTDYKV